MYTFVHVRQDVKCSTVVFKLPSEHCIQSHMSGNSIIYIGLSISRAVIILQLNYNIYNKSSHIREIYKHIRTHVDAVHVPFDYETIQNRHKIR